MPCVLVLVADLRCAELEQQRHADSKRLSAAAAEKDKLQEKYYTDVVRQVVMQLRPQPMKATCPGSILLWNLGSKEPCTAAAAH